MTSALTVSDLRVSYTGTVALQNVSLELRPSELLVILGPTGAGKTTLLRTIAGLQESDSGVISIGGRIATHSPPADRDIAMVFQNFSLYPDRTVRENLSFPLRSPSSRIAEEEIESRVEWAADMLRIRRLLNRPATQLSGGEMQRVAIGRAIVRRPRIFLFDEPLTNLDAKLRESLRVEIIALQKELGVPMIYVTHDQAEALSMADRIVVLTDGCVSQMGTASDVYERPATPGVARQLGYPLINLFEVTQVNGYWISSDGDRLAPSDGKLDRATLGIRPENIGTTGGPTAGTIRIVENLGPSCILLVDYAGTELHILADRDSSHHPGDTIRPAFHPDRLLVWPNHEHVNG